MISNTTFKVLPTLTKHLGMEFVEITSDTLTLPDAGRRTGRSSPTEFCMGEPLQRLLRISRFDGFLLNLGRGSAKVGVGIDLNISHLKAVHEGYVRARPNRSALVYHSTWEIRIVNDADGLIAFSRLTTMILDKPLEKSGKVEK